MMGFQQAVIIAFLLSVSILSQISAAIVGIDLGSGFFKVASALPGRSIEIVPNKHSQRKTPTAISFMDELREFGELALNHLTKSPYDVVAFVPDLLSYTAQQLESALDKYTYLKLGPHTDHVANILIPARNLTLTADAVLAHILKAYHHDITRFHNSKHGLRLDVVFGIPEVFGLKEKQALLNAAFISNIHVLKLVSETAAAGVAHAIDLPQNYTGTKLFVNMGATKIQACVIGYTYSSQNPVTRVREVRVRGCSAAKACGGRHFDLILTQYFLDQAVAHFGSAAKSDLNQPKMIQRFLKQAQHVKLILSTNKQADFHLEEVYDGRDFTSKVTRQQFEEMITPELGALDLMIQRAIALSKVPLQNITQAELIGGGTRVPLIQKHLSTQSPIKDMSIGQHLNSDEAVAYGAALLAANASSLFRLKALHFYPTSNARYTLSVKQHGGDASSQKTRSKALVDIGDLWTEGIRTFTLKTCNDFTAQLTETRGYDNSTVVLYDYEISGVQEACQALITNGTLNTTMDNSTLAKVGMVFFTKETGILGLSRVIAQWDIPAASAQHNTNSTGSNETSTEASPASSDAGSVNASKTNSTSSTSPPADSATNNTDNTSTAVLSNATKTKGTTEKPVWVKRTVECQFTVKEHAPIQLNESEITAARSDLERSEAHDTQLMRLHKLKNEIEEEIYETRSRLLPDNDLFGVMNTSYVDAANEKLDQLESWIYAESADATLEYVQAKLEEFRSFVKEAVDRVTEIQEYQKYTHDLQELIHLLDTDIRFALETEYEVSSDAIKAFQHDLEVSKTFWTSLNETQHTSEQVKIAFSDLSKAYETVLKQAKKTTTTTMSPTSTPPINNETKSNSTSENAPTPTILDEL